MKLLTVLTIAILCLTLVLADETNGASSEPDQLDVIKLAKDDGDTKTSESQRKRDSGYSYSRPDRFSSSQRHEISGIRGRIISRYPSSQKIRPFNNYGPPKHSSAQFGRPSSQYAPQHQYSGPYNRPSHSTGFGNQENQFTNSPSNGQMQQEVPSPIRTYDFVEPSPIASQNNEPFNSNAASYLPPRNQKLPSYSNSQIFSNQPKPIQPQEDNRNQLTNQQQQQQQPSFNNFQSQNLLQSPAQEQPQISDAALFLAQNAQAISQLYETPAVNVNYEPIQNFPSTTDAFQNPNNQFQTFDVNNAQAVQSQGLQDSRGFQGRLPSYASGILDPQQALQQIQSLEKDRLISQLQRALVTAQVKSENNEASTSRYAQNHANGNFIQSQEFTTSIGTQINPSIGPQLDKPNRFNNQRPFGNQNPAFGGTHIHPGTTTTTSGFPFTYGLPSTTPTQSPSTTTTTATSTTTTSQRPVQGVTGDGTSQVGSSVLPPSGTPPTYPFPQYGGFVPTLIGTNLIANYPAYGSAPSSIIPIQSSGSSPTHIGLPIPTLPAGSQGTTSNKPLFPPKPQEPSGQHHHPVHTIPLQPIHPIAATPVQPIYPIAPAVTQVHPVQSPPPASSGHPAYGVQPAVINPILLKPVKAVYPVYYYPNVYPIQKPALPTYPWSYAPSYAQTKPAQIWK